VSQLSQPIEPFRIAGNIYYVGASNIASYLFATSRGVILLDTGTREMLPMVQSSIVKLGFKLTDVKIILSSHAHWEPRRGPDGDEARDRCAGHGDRRGGAGAVVGQGPDGRPARIGWEPVAVDRVPA